MKRKLYAAVIVLEGLLAAVVLTFLFPLLDSHLLGNVQGKGSPTWFWLVHGSPRQAAILALSVLTILIAVDIVRRLLRRSWRKELEW